MVASKILNSKTGPFRCQILYLKLLYWKAGGNERPPGGPRGQFPCTDFGPAAQIYSSNAARTPKTSLVSGNYVRIQNVNITIKHRHKKYDDSNVDLFTMRCLQNNLCTVPSEDVRAENSFLWPLKHNRYPDEKELLQRWKCQLSGNTFSCVLPPVLRHNAWEDVIIKTKWFPYASQEITNVNKNDRAYNDVSMFFFRAYRWFKQEWQ